MNNKPIISLQWHITTSCDQRCKHCYLFNSPNAKKEIQGSKKINLDTLKAIVDNFKVGCEHLNAIPKIYMTGGDPILSPYFWDLLTYLQQLNINTALMGNPFHITNKTAQRLYSLSIRDYQMSLDGLQETHDSFRKKGSFKATLKAIDILQKNKINVSIMSTVSKENANEISNLVKLLVKRKVSSHAFARFCPNYNEDTKSMFEPLEYKAFLERMWQTYDELWNKGTKFFLKDHLWNLFLIEKGLFKPEPTNGIIVAGCGMGIFHLTVLADGTVYACRRFESPVGKMPQQNFDTIFKSQKMDEFRIKENYKKCCDCELFVYCRGCSAVSACVTGSWKSPDPQCWKI